MTGLPLRIAVDDRASAALATLANKVVRREYRDAGRQVAKAVQADARAGIRRQTGFTARQIKIRSRTKKGRITWYVAPDREKAWYAYCLENGHVKGAVRGRVHARRAGAEQLQLALGGRWVAGRPFMQPAARRHLDGFPAALEAAIETLVAEANRSDAR